MKEVEVKKKRAPIISVMGHVDHGKTTLLDFLKKTNVASKETGGITQRIRAFRYPYQDNFMTFIDTPGHEAFSQMREKGSKLTDIILLVVAADDGVKPQTKEVINLAKTNNIPMVVAINKVDLPNIDIRKVKTELSTAGVLLEGWGGDVVSVEVSAKTGQGVDNLLEMLHLTSELEDLKEEEGINRATVLESYLDKNLGAVNIVIVQSGVFKVGDFVGEAKIRAILNDDRERINEAGVSMPVMLLGLSGVLETGTVITANNTKSHMDAKAKDAESASVEEEDLSNSSPKDILDALMSQSKKEEGKPKLNIILKADFAGSIEAIMSELGKGKNENVDLNVIRSGTGEISESDVAFAKATKAILIGFNINISEKIKSLAAKEKVILMSYAIIYELVDDVLGAAESLIPPEISEVEVGKSEVINVFKLSNGNYVAGSIVKDGRMVKNYNCYVLRGNERLYDGKITSMRHLKDEINEAKQGIECGISTAPNFEFMQGDMVVCFRIEKS